MRILLISYYFPPFNTVGALRPSKLAFFWEQQGHDVHVLSCANQPFPLGLPLGLSPEKVSYASSWSVNAPIEWLRGGRQKTTTEGFTADIPNNSLRYRLGQLYKLLLHWPDAQIGWVSQAIRIGRAILQRDTYDLIYVSAPSFSGFRVAAKLVKEFQIPWIAEYRDLWTDNHGTKLPVWKIAMTRRWESKLVSTAIALVTVSPPLVEKLKHFNRPVWEVRNGYSEEETHAPDLNADLTELDHVKMVFTGSIYDDYYDVDTFCKGVAQYVEQGGKIKIHVAGRNTNGLRASAMRHRITEHFVFQNTVPHATALVLQQSADILLSFLWQGEDGAGIYSAKLFEYAASKHPILAIGEADSDVGLLIKNSGLGVVCTSTKEIVCQLTEWQRLKAIGKLSVSINKDFDFSRQGQFLRLNKHIDNLMTAYAKRQRVCFVIANPFALNAFLSAPIAYLASHGWDISVVVNINQSEITAIDSENHAYATIIPLAIVRAISPLADLLAMLRLRRILKQGRYDIVHSITPKAGLLAMVSAYSLGVPVRLHTCTGQVWATQKGWKRFLLKNIDRVMAKCTTSLLVDSPSQGEFLLKNNIVKNTQLHVLGQGSVCGVDTQRFCPNSEAKFEIRQQLRIPEDAIVLLFLGRLNVEKGIHELVQAFEKISPDFSALHLVLVGPDEGALSNIEMTQSQLNTRIHVVEATRTPERYMAAADIFCLPSYREGFGLSLIEAAAVGLPSVATKIYGITDAVIDGVTGLLVSPRNILELSHAIRQMVSDPSMRYEMGEAAKTRAKLYFSQPRILHEWLTYYQSR